MAMLTFGLTMVRHGETQYNKDKLLQGQGIDSPLSEIGKQQAEAAGNYLREVKFTNVFSSNMRRARQTADIIVKNNVHCSGVEIVSDPQLKERNMKDMAKAAGQSCPDFTPPQGETPEQPVWDQTLGDALDHMPHIRNSWMELVQDEASSLKGNKSSFYLIKPVKVRIRGFLKSMFERIVADHCVAGQSYPTGGNHPAQDVEELLAGYPADGVWDLPVHALVVGHGAYMRVAVRYLVEELHCTVPSCLKMSHVFSACPNTGMCRFILTLRQNDTGIEPTDVSCIFINRRDHLQDGEDKQ
ncbi:hypothetical protein JZ751_016828 [Albula glossodonta]|uniref:Fructose-2,6-bisphosphatase TIGAR n=1 Tax=Albula glossodonta TaxID=121402 RepID=A0A8T2NRX5_9TELE|nr:hypothetical protein JZ751_016828 [Albula glossodonta]